MRKNKRESMEEIRERLKKEKEEASKDKQNVVAQLAHQEEETDFATIAAELEARKKAEAKGENDNHIKDTLYIEESIYKSFNALCIKRGDKKKLVNRALAEFVEREYKKLKNNR